MQVQLSLAESEAEVRCLNGFLSLLSCIIQDHGPRSDAAQRGLGPTTDQPSVGIFPTEVLSSKMTLA